MNVRVHLSVAKPISLQRVRDYISASETPMTDRKQQQATEPRKLATDRSLDGFILQRGVSRCTIDLQLGFREFLPRKNGKRREIGSVDR